MTSRGTEKLLKFYTESEFKKEIVIGKLVLEARPADLDKLV